MAKCENQSVNLKICNCTYPCSKKGLCCECIRYHLSMQELPACFFPKDVEATFDRSFRRFVQLHRNLLG